jgi:spoIIIJ-associated protein
VEGEASVGEGTPPETSFEMPEEPAQRVRVVLERILDGLKLEASIEITEDEEAISAQLDGSDLGLLIGRRGQTIDAVQLLCFQAAFRGYQERKRVVVDAAGYREKRRQILERKADQAAERALEAGRPIELESMSAQERRMVHNHLADRAEVETYSEGDEPHRCVVVSPLLPE